MGVAHRRFQVLAELYRGHVIERVFHELATLSDGEGELDASRNHVAQVAKISAFEASTENQHDRPVEAFERGPHRLDVGRFGVVVKADTTQLANFFERMCESLKMLESVFDGFARDAEKRRCRRGGHRVRAVMRTRHRELFERSKSARLTVLVPDDPRPFFVHVWIELTETIKVEIQLLGLRFSRHINRHRISAEDDGPVVLALVLENARFGLHVI